MQIIDLSDPDIGAELKRTTEVVFHDYHSPDSWTQSLLNRTGAPLEFSFSTLSDDLRYTMEVGKHGTPPNSKLSLMERLLDQLGYTWTRSEPESSMVEMQADVDLDWGAWLGVRHGKRGISVKKYAEIPNQQGKEVHRLLREYLPLLVASMDNFALPVMMGNTLGSQRCEFYFELIRDELSLSDIKYLLSRVGLEHRCELLVELIRSFQFRRESNHPALRFGRCRSIPWF